MKKTVLLFAGLLTFVFLTTACTTPPTTTENQEEFTATTAQEQLDIDVVVKAVQTKNKDLCNTIESSDQRDNCISKIDDQVIYESALADSDLDECDTIQQSSKKEQCIIFVEQEIENNEAVEIRLKEIEAVDAIREAEMGTLDELVSRKDLKAGDCEVLKDPDFRAGCVEVAEIISGP